MSSLRGFHWVASPFQPPLPQEGKGMGNKRSKHVQRDHGAFMLCPGLGETRLHLAQHHSLHAGYDLQGGDPWDSGCCQKLPAPQLEEQRERKLEAPAGYRTGAICWKGPELGRPGLASGNPIPHHNWGEGSLALGRPVLKDSLHSMDSFINSFRKSYSQTYMHKNEPSYFVNCFFFFLLFS